MGASKTTKSTKILVLENFRLYGMFLNVCKTLKLYDFIFHECLKFMKILSHE